LGGTIARQPSQATHLIVDDKIERTAKLLKCMSTCSYILNKKWLIDSKADGKFVDPLTLTSTGDYLYQPHDAAFEKRYNCASLKEAIERARENSTKPLLSVIFIFQFIN
jgi:hypothetical protein